HAIKSYFGCIWNIRKHGVFHIIIHVFEYLPAKQAAKLFAFAVNRRFAPPGKINAFERAGFLLKRVADHVFAYPAILFYDQGMSGLYFLYLFDWYVECRLQRRSFRSRDHDLVIFKVIGRPYANRVAHYKGIAMA